MIGFLIIGLIKTTFITVEKKCSKCNKSFNVKNVVTTNSKGSGDLDFRPPPMQRDTMEAWIQRCPYCGYSSPDIEKENSISTSFLKSQEYQSILTNTKYPELCISFLCWAELAKELKLYDESAAAYLRAAWVCDDKFNELSNESIELRKKAIVGIDKAHANNQLLIKSPKSDELLMLDLLRRTAQFDSCIEYARKKFKLKRNDFHDKVALYQIKLCENRDQKIHKLSEIDQKEL